MSGVSDTTAGLLIIIFSFIGLIGNGFIVMVSWKKKLYYRRVYYLIMSLAVSDGINSFIQVVQDGFSIIFQKVTISGLWNRAFGWLFVHCFQLHVTKAIFIITIQAVFMYRKDYGDKYLTKRNALLVVLFLWLFPFWQTIFLLPFYPFTDMTCMSFIPEARIWFFNMSYPIAVPLNEASGVYLIFCFILGCLSSFLILFKIWKTRNEVIDVSIAQSQTLEMRRLSVQFISVIGLWLFQSILFYTLPTYCWNSPEAMFLLTLTNPFLFGSNFFIYLLVNRSFRKAFREVFKPEPPATSFVSTSIPLVRRSSQK